MKNCNTSIYKYQSSTGPSEYHLIVEVVNPMLNYEQQLAELMAAYSESLNQLSGAVSVFKRYFLSDAANQADLLMANETSGCAVSVVEQPPLNSTKIALWAYLVTDVQTRTLPGGLFEVAHGDYRHYYIGSAYNRAATSEYQTRLLLNDYVMQLLEQGCTLAENCVRTWFFVQNVDVNYGGVVKARKEVFLTQGLTEKTHYIASTGIGGRHADAKVLVQMDSYAIGGLQPGQVKYLYAPTHLNPTYEYGVTFERGSYVEYGDRRHVYISGTASINNRGEVVHVGDVHQQTLRMWENVEVLLAEAGCGYDDVAYMLVYLRDTADYAVVKQLYDERFPDKPKVFLLAPVCRSGWLVEMECMAVKDSQSSYPSF